MKLNTPTADVMAALSGMGLADPDEPCEIKPLGGGVSCDVFEVRNAERTICVKRALPKLRVTADWRAPAERSHAEVAWMELVAGIDPNWVPAILGEDRARHLFAMEYFPPQTHPVWKGVLAEGKADANFSARVGEALAQIHAATAGRDDIAHQFVIRPVVGMERDHLLFQQSKQPGKMPVLGMPQCNRIIHAASSQKFARTRAG